MKSCEKTVKRLSGLFPSPAHVKFHMQALIMKSFNNEIFVLGNSGKPHGTTCWSYYYTIGVWKHHVRPLEEN